MFNVLTQSDSQTSCPSTAWSSCAETALFRCLLWPSVHWHFWPQSYSTMLASILCGECRLQSSQRLAFCRSLYALLPKIEWVLCPLSFWFTRLMFIHLRCKIKPLDCAFGVGGPVYIGKFFCSKNSMIQQTRCFVHAQLTAFNLCWCFSAGIISRSNTVWVLESKWTPLISDHYPTVFNSVTVCIPFFLKRKLSYAVMKNVFGVKYCRILPT